MNGKPRYQLAVFRGADGRLCHVLTKVLGGRRLGEVIQAHVDFWIGEHKAGTSAMVVLFGAETAERPWIWHEISQSVVLVKGLLAIAIHNIRDLRSGNDIANRNRLDLIQVNRAGVLAPLSRFYCAYDWVNDNDRQNTPAWIESPRARRAAKPT